MLSLAGLTMARPEAPRGQFPIPQSPPLRQQLPRQNYGPPPPSDNYGELRRKMFRNFIIQQLFSPSGPPQTPVSSYGPPASSYGAPNKPIITKNVYVHLPPNDVDDVQVPQTLEAQPPQKHYKLIFIKAPEPPKPVAPIIPAQPQDEHKTLGRIDCLR